MGFLAPLFLVGALAIALPIWLHRLQTQSSDRQSFSSAMLLETTEERVHLQKKLKYLVLLALRIALLLMIALAFAKPFLNRPPTSLTAGAAGTHLILVDTSVSMSRAGVFDQAIAVASQAVDDVPPGTLLQLLNVDDALHIGSSLSADKAAHRAAISELKVSALRLDFGRAMAAVDRLAESFPPPVTLHLISDFQGSAMPVRFADVVPSRVTRLIPYVVGTGSPFNWSVKYVRETAEGLDVGLMGFGDRERVADVELLLNGEVVETRGLSETGPVTLHFTNLQYEQGDNRIQVRINTDDDLAADNQWFHVVENEPPASVPLITLNRGGLPVTYLSAALESDAGQSYHVEPLVIGEFDARVLGRYRWALLDDIGAIDEELDHALTAYLQNGGNLLAFSGIRAANSSVLPVTGHRMSAATVGFGGNEFQSPEQIDTSHPVLAQTEGWHTVNVSRTVPIEVQAADQVLIRLENKQPFLIERRIGAGRLLLLLNGLDNRWNDLPLRPVFVSFIIETAGYLSGINEISKTYTTGASLPLSLVGNASGQVVDPDGNTVLSLADTTRAQQINLDKPGFYEVYTSQDNMLVAANIDPRESDLTRISQELLDRWQDATARLDGIVAGQPGTVEPEPVELWHWLLFILAMVVIAESMLGNTYLAPLARANR
ncbi:MAG: BatA domain-containing protein [Proteobacteria bacterium]|nr:BatA domain-containing protein [Pseudomonadota bacterium]